MSQRQTVLITGASSGIGRELAFVFAQHGYDVILVARSHERLQQVASDITKQYGCQAEVFCADLAQPYAARQLYEEVRQSGQTVDVLVNNAGFGDYVQFIDEKEDSFLEMIQLNIATLTQLTWLFLPGMLERRHGGVMNIASTAAFEPGPYMAVYFASKAYVLSFTEGLSIELQDTDISVTAVCPGPTGTSFEIRASQHGVPLFLGKVMSAKRVAEIAYAGFEKKKVVVITGLKNKLLVFLNRCVPRAVVRKAMYRIMK